MDHNVLMELNKLRQLIDSLQQQLQRQQTEIESVKEISLKAQTPATVVLHQSKKPYIYLPNMF
jgi:hypothetical protein